MSSITGSTHQRLVFGIYPGSAAGDGPGMQSGRLDDPAQINSAIDQLCLPDGRFVVRGYWIYTGNGKVASMTPDDLFAYAAPNRDLELVLCFRSLDGDIDDWTRFIDSLVQRYGAQLATLQVTEEPNNPDATAGGDGSSPNIFHAIIRGVIAAKAAAQRYGSAVRVGFNAAPSLDNSFWETLGEQVTAEFLDALDFVGFDFFPDVFRPLPSGADGKLISVYDATVLLLSNFRQSQLAAGGIPVHVPIRITENGWPTSPTRTAERQADVLEAVVRAVDSQRESLHITHYIYFDLRDADSSSEVLQFGLLRDDYSPKPAFERYRQLIAELGTV